MAPYNVHLAQELKPTDHPMRFRFDKWACHRLLKDGDFAKKNLFRWSSFWACRECKQAQLAPLGHQKHAYMHWKSNASGFWFRGIFWVFVQSKFIKNWKMRMLATFDFNIRATKPYLQLVSCFWWSHYQSVIHLGAAIW